MAIQIKRLTNSHVVAILLAVFCCATLTRSSETDPVTPDRTSVVLKSVKELRQKSQGDEAKLDKSSLNVSLHVFGLDPQRVRAAGNWRVSGSDSLLNKVALHVDNNNWKEFKRNGERIYFDIADDTAIPLNVLLQAPARNASHLDNIKGDVDVLMWTKTRVCFAEFGTDLKSQKSELPDGVSLEPIGFTKHREFECLIVKVCAPADEQLFDFFAFRVKAEDGKRICRGFENVRSNDKQPTIESKFDLGKQTARELRYLRFFLDYKPESTFRIEFTVLSDEKRVKVPFDLGRIELP